MQGNIERAARATETDASTAKASETCANASAEAKTASAEAESNAAAADATTAEATKTTTAAEACTSALCAAAHEAVSGELSALTASRANVYKLLSRCFEAEIDESFAFELAHTFAFECDDEKLTVELAAMRASVADADEAAIEQLAVAFNRVFFGMGPLNAKKAFPYESVYTSDRGIMMQDAYAKMVHALRENDLAKDASFTEPEDHLAVELAFMATLATRSLDAVAEGSDEDVVAELASQLKFLREHLLNWTDRFCVDLANADANGFYCHLARFTHRFLELDEQLLAELIEA